MESLFQALITNDFHSEKIGLVRKLPSLSELGLRGFFGHKWKVYLFLESSGQGQLHLGLLSGVILPPLL